MSRKRYLAASLLVHSLGCNAEDLPTLGPLEVVAPAYSLGAADAASQGVVTKDELSAHPVYRTGEILEHVPGLVVTQHSGEGKANQYFLRGFNLDHGTDFAITVDGVPVNMRTHAHGQGYADLNFLIPEVIGALRYRKGPHHAEEGDFAAAGAARLELADRLERGVGEAGVGQQGYRRALIAGSPSLGNGHLLYALELMHNDGPWSRPDDYGKINAVLRVSQGSRENGFNVTAMAYSANWNATDQVARRAVDSGEIGRFDSLDPSDGGRSHRYALSAGWRATSGDARTEANAYLVRSDLKLYSNFTYFLNDPVNGDQFEQNDRRVMSGANVKHSRSMRWGGIELENTAGLQLRNDHIAVGLFDTRARQRLATKRSDRVTETSAGLFVENVTYWTKEFRTTAAVRADWFSADVDSDTVVNSGRASDRKLSPKVGAVFGPWSATELFVNAGRGFHSNDARGTTITVDPGSGAPAQRVPFLVGATGYEAGVRSALAPGLTTSLAAFRLDIASELVFVGDAGTTEPSRPSRRSGLELSSVYVPRSGLTLDADVAFSRARFRDDDPAGSRIPGAIEGVASLKAAFDRNGPWFGSVRMRYFGPRPLTEADNVRSSSTTLLSGRIGYRFSRTMRVQLDGFNLLDRKSSQIDYYYESRLRGEAAPVADVHFHPTESRAFRLTLVASF